MSYVRISYELSYPTFTRLSGLFSITIGTVHYRSYYDLNKKNFTIRPTLIIFSLYLTLHCDPHFDQYALFILPDPPMNSSFLIPQQSYTHNKVHNFIFGRCLGPLFFSRSATIFSHDSTEA